VVNDPYDTRLLGYVRPTQSSVMQIIHIIYSNVFWFIYRNVCLLLSLCMYISQVSVKKHLWCGGIYNNHIIANCPHSVPVKKI